MKKTNKFSPEVRERAVRMVQEQRGEYPSLWAAIESIAPKIGCVPQTLNEWVKRAEVDAGTREGVTAAEAQRVKELEREVKELRRANEILKLASAFFAQAELDRRLKSCDPALISRTARSWKLPLYGESRCEIANCPSGSTRMNSKSRRPGWPNRSEATKRRADWVFRWPRWATGSVAQPQQAQAHLMSH